MNRIKMVIILIIVHLTLIIGGETAAQDFGIYDLSAKTNLDSTDILMLSIASDSTYYKLLWDRIVDSVEDSLRGQIVNAWIASGAAIALNKLASGTSAYFIVNNGSGVPTYVAMSGDATLANTGAITIAANAIGSSEITDNTITSSDILDETITTSDIDDGTITNADINSSAAIALSKLATGTAAYIIVNNSGGVPTYVALSGDATISNAGVFDLNDTQTDDFTFSGHTISTGLTDITSFERYYADDIETALTSDHIFGNFSAQTSTSGVDITGFKSKVTSVSNPTANVLTAGYFEVIGSGSSGGSVNYAVYAKASGTGSVYAGYFEGNQYTSGDNTTAGSITSTQFKLSALNTAPASAGATGTLGEIRIVDGYIYVCTATNTWKRCAIATW